MQEVKKWFRLGAKIRTFLFLLYLKVWFISFDHLKHYKSNKSGQILFKNINLKKVLAASGVLWAGVSVLDNYIKPWTQPRLEVRATRSINLHESLPISFKVSWAATTPGPVLTSHRHTSTPFIYIYVPCLPADLIKPRWWKICITSCFLSGERRGLMISSQHQHVFNAAICGLLATGIMSRHLFCSFSGSIFRLQLGWWLC